MSEKGHFASECNRSDCTNLAEFWNRHDRRYYCRACVHRLDVDEITDVCALPHFEYPLKPDDHDRTNDPVFEPVVDDPLEGIDNA